MWYIKTLLAGVLPEVDMASELNASLLSELERLHDRVERLELEAGLVDTVKAWGTKAKEFLSKKLTAASIHLYIQNKLKVDQFTVDNDSKIQFKYMNSDYAVTKVDDKTFQIAKDGGQAMKFSSFSELDTHLKSLTMKACPADLARYSRAVMRSRAGML